MAQARLAYIIAVRRIISGWGLELILFLGMLMAVALLSSAVIFSNLLAEAALRHALSEATPEQANFWVRVFSGQDAPPTTEGRNSLYKYTLDFAEDRIAARVKPHLRDQGRFFETSTFFFTGHPLLELDNEVRPRGEIKYVAGLTPERMEVVQGRWPQIVNPGAPLSPSNPLEVALDILGAELLQLGPGDEMGAFPAASFTDPESIPVKVVGVFRRTDPDDEFWYGAERTFSYKNDQWTIVPLFTTEEVILKQIFPVYPSLYTDTTWFYYLDRNSVRAAQVDDLLNSLRSIKYDVRANLNNSSSRIRLDGLLEDYKEQLLLAQIPLFLILFLMIGILTYYLALITGLVVKSRAAEIAMLKSRGATTGQVGSLALVEGLLLATPAVILGPLLAMGVVKLLGRVFFGLGGGGNLSTVPVELSSSAFLLGLAGGVLGVIVLTASTLFAARQGIVEFRQMGARPPKTPFIHRYYLDIVFLALIGLFLWQIKSQGSFLVRPLGSQGLELDWSHLLIPLLLLLAIGLLVMRLFPMVVGVLARLAETVGPSWLVHGLRHVSRDPIVPGALVVLLMLATALGVIGSAFSSTLERSQRDRALYAAGADLRLEYSGSNAPRPLQGLSELVRRTGLTNGVAEVQRTTGHITTTGFSTSGVLLAVEAREFSKVAWFRNDFADGMPLGEVTALLAPGPDSNPPVSQGIELPEDATALALSVQVSRPNNRLNLWARLHDSQGIYFDILMGDLKFVGWQRLQGEIVPYRPVQFIRGRDAQEVKLSRPYSLVSLHLSRRGGDAEPGALFMSDLVAVGPRGEESVDDFQSIDGWRVVEDYSKPGLSVLESSESVATPGFAKSARFSWAPGSIGIRGIRPGPEEKPIPAVVSRRFLEVADAKVGDVRTVGLSTFALLLQIKAVVDYFPTVDPNQKPFAIVDLETYIQQANLHSPRPFGGSNELWVHLPDGNSSVDAVTAAVDGKGARVRATYVASDMVLQRVEQPLVTAGWGGLLVLLFLALVLASASGVMLFSFIDSRERQTEFALLRTLGSSRRQLNGAVWFNIVLIAICGIVLGTGAGLFIGVSLLPLMEVAEEGTRVTPSMVLQIDWLTMGVSYLVLATGTAGTVAWLAWFTAKMQLHQVLRIGEG